MAKNSNGKIALGAAIGAAAGAVAGFVTGILTAPKSGKETRGDIANTADKTKKEVIKKATEVKAKAGTVAEDVVDKAEELRERTEQAVAGAKKGFNTKPTSTTKK